MVRVPRLVLLRSRTLAFAGLAVGILAHPELSAATTLACEGSYADTLQIESARTREIEQGPRSQYSYLVRSSVRYDCPFFGPDGKLRRRRVQASELGTAFAYEASGTDTYLLTNEHVAAWPEVTDSSHHVEDVPDGCKRVEDKLRIVRDEHDDFESGQIPLTRVAVDALLDVAILKASQRLVVMPFKVGRSAALRQGDVVEVRGFPLGVMQAVSSGKIVNAYDHDQEQGWDHVDFVIDALLAEGNAGSPVLAVSCRSRELELVGLYHTGHKGHGALNAVVGIDQVRELMRKKRRIPRGLAEAAAPGAPGAAERARVSETLAGGALPLFDFGGLFVRAESGAGGALLYHLYGRQFPLDDRQVSVIEDLPEEGSFGALARFWVREPGGWREWRPSALGADERDLLVRVGDSIRLQLLHTIDFRRTLANPGSADERRRGRDLARAIAHDVPVARDAVGTFLDTIDRLSSGRDSGLAVSSAVAGGLPAPSQLPPLEPPSSKRTSTPESSRTNDTNDTNEANDATAGP
jgi:serine protease Do